MTRNINRNVGLLLMATLLITSMSGIVGAAYDEDGNYVEDVPAYVNEEFVYVAEPFDYLAAASTAWAYPYDYSTVFAMSYAEPFDGSTVATDMTVPGVQGLGAEE